MSHATIGVIGGSGLYQMEGLTDIREVAVETPFGAPSDKFIIGELEGVTVAFLARHGRGHRLLPSELPFQANIFAMKQLGVQRILSASAVGSLKAEHKPLDIVLPDQFFDRTFQRASTFFGEGLVAHIAFADPVCLDLCKTITAASQQLPGVEVHPGGTYVCMEGPAFSTRAESNIYRSWGMDIIGMTNLQEAKLAREAEICYSTIALVTDYDCWHEDHDAVTVEMVIQNLTQNAINAQKLIRETIKLLSSRPRQCGCDSALKHAILTAPNAINPAALARLQPIVGKYFPAVVS
jgi:5'-methylthioadenosine phosphorylase